MENQVVEKQETPAGMGLGLGVLDGLMPEGEIKKLETDVQAKVKEIFPEGSPEVKKEVISKEAATPDPKSAENPEELLKNTTFFNKTIVKEEPVVLKDWDETAKYLSENTGLEVKEPTDISKVVSEYKSLKEISGKAQEFEKKVKGFEAIFDNLPDEVFGVVQAALKNEDYRALMKDMIKETIDFNIPFDKQDKKEMLNYFYPGKFSDDDFEDEDNNAVKFALEEASKKYSDAKKANDSKPTFKQRFEEKTASEKKLINESALASWNTFSQGKQIDDSRKNKIGSMLESGWNGIYNTLFDEKGAWKPDAAEKLFWMQYATEELAIAEKVIAAKAKSKAVEEMIDRGADKLSLPGGSKGSPSLSKEQAAQKAAELLLT